MKTADASIEVLNVSPADKTFLILLLQMTKCLEKIRKGELERYVKKLSCSERELAESFTIQFVNRIIPTTRQLEIASRRSDGKNNLPALGDLFNPESALIRRKIE
jgi:glutamyl-tRNA reductase